MAVLMAALGPCVISAGQTDKRSDGPFLLRPIGRVEKATGRTRLVPDATYQDGLLGLDGFSHVQVLWWFDKSDTPQNRSTLRVHPHGDQGIPLTGVFATRGSSRPNLIALSLCRIISIRDNIVEVDGIDAFSDTPILDIKPYGASLDSASPARVPDWWAKPRPQE